MRKNEKVVEFYSNLIKNTIHKDSSGYYIIVEDPYYRAKKVHYSRMLQAYEENQRKEGK